MKPFILVFAILCQLLPIPNARAQSCINTIVPTTPEARFQSIREGTILDTQTHLLWMRCAIGQQWQNNQCHGSLLAMSWQDALRTADTTRFAGYDDWRLPNLYELSGITELKCQSPAANLQLFPDTAAHNYWTSTEFVNTEGYAWLVHFEFGESHTSKNNLPAYVRLVRRIQR